MWTISPGGGEENSGLYRIEVNDDATEWRGLVAGVTGNTYRAVGGCVGAVTCAYRVRAENAVETGDWSNVPTLTTAPSVVRIIRRREFSVAVPR